jgi:hypothetical protein
MLVFERAATHTMSPVPSSAQVADVFIRNLNFPPQERVVGLMSEQSSGNDFAQICAQLLVEHAQACSVYCHCVTQCIACKKRTHTIE